MGCRTAQHQSVFFFMEKNVVTPTTWIANGEVAASFNKPVKSVCPSCWEAFVWDLHLHQSLSLTCGALENLSTVWGFLWSRFCDLGDPPLFFCLPLAIEGLLSAWYHLVSGFFCFCFSQPQLMLLLLLRKYAYFVLEIPGKGTVHLSLVFPFQFTHHSPRMCG